MFQNSINLVHFSKKKKPYFGTFPIAVEDGSNIFKACGFAREGMCLNWLQDVNNNAVRVFKSEAELQYPWKTNQELEKQTCEGKKNLRSMSKIHCASKLNFGFGTPRRHARWNFMYPVPH